jgi:asparagine N-glycosylation enzyme membrane subunit Stt3
VVQEGCCWLLGLSLLQHVGRESRSAMMALLWLANLSVALSHAQASVCHFSLLSAFLNAFALLMTLSHCQSMIWESHLVNGRCAS